METRRYLLRQEAEPPACILFRISIGLPNDREPVRRQDNEPFFWPCASTRRLEAHTATKAPV